MGVQGIRPGWATVLEMPDTDLRLTTAERNYRRRLDETKPEDYLDSASFMSARQELHAAYDQACRELGNPG